MAKNFKTDTLSKLGAAGQEQQLDQTDEKQVPKSEPIEPHKTSRKRGRPKTKDVKNTCRYINVAIPTDLLDKWDEIKIVHGSNLTGYIAKLIDKDLTKNYDKYKQMTNDLKNI